MNKVYKLAIEQRKKQIKTIKITTYILIGITTYLLFRNLTFYSSIGILISLLGFISLNTMESDLHRLEQEELEDKINDFIK